MRQQSWWAIYRIGFTLLKNVNWIYSVAYNRIYGVPSWGRFWVLNPMKITWTLNQSDHELNGPIVLTFAQGGSYAVVVSTYVPTEMGPFSSPVIYSNGLSEPLVCQKSPLFVRLHWLTGYQVVFKCVIILIPSAKRLHFALAICCQDKHLKNSEELIYVKISGISMGLMGSHQCNNLHFYANLMVGTQKEVVISSNNYVLCINASDMVPRPHLKRVTAKCLKKTNKVD